MSPDPAPGGEATNGTVAAVLESRPRWRCVNGHDAGPVIDHERARQQVETAVPVARRRRLRGGDVCVACGSVLSMPVRRTVWPVTLTDPARRAAVTLTYDVPVTRCPSCGSSQVPTRSADDLLAVVDELVPRE
ncbi:hypothetical protein [Egicoccus sp. AB-alg2]|uniref:hypothetical protein n=1 Tax=Egicoccus sp. AB-alg2 TaxID=3242693 RepID=UPI00359D3E17